MTYDEWKTTDPRDREPYFGKCPVCKSRHWEHERCEGGPNGRDSMTKKAAKLIDKRIEAAYYRTCSGIAIPMLAIPKVFAAGRAALAAGADEAGLEYAITAFVETIRV